MDIKNEIIRIFEENGIDSSNPIELENIDSIQYVAIIVEIEQLLNIILPDFVVGTNTFIDFDGFVNIVINTYEHNCDFNKATSNIDMLSDGHIGTE